MITQRIGHKQNGREKVNTEHVNSSLVSEPLGFPNVLSHIGTSCKKTTLDVKGNH